MCNKTGLLILDHTQKNGTHLEKEQSFRERVRGKELYQYRKSKEIPSPTCKVVKAWIQSVTIKFMISRAAVDQMTKYRATQYDIMLQWTSGILWRKKIEAIEKYEFKEKRSAFEMA